MIEYFQSFSIINCSQICYYRRQMSSHDKDKNQFINQYMAEKAGMAQVDKNKIAEIIQKITEGTPKSQYEKQMSQKRQLQLTQMLRKTLEFTPEQKKQIKQQWLPQIQRMNSTRSLDKYWAHLDFDMFYVACQILDKPELKDKPCAVGGQNSVICTANYIARKYGVRSALPTFIAKKLCPQVVLIPPDFKKYKKYSNIFRDILRKYDQNLESMGLDEAYVQLTQQMKDKTIDQQQKLINEIREQIFKQTGLTVSCGVGANKMLAKLASEQKKPNGQFILENTQQKILEFMKTKKIRKIPGIGPVNQFFLKGLGIQSASDILQNTDTLSICFSRNSTQFYVAAALGLGSTQHEFVERKSLGKSQTFKATNDIQYILQKIFQICQEVSMELQQLGYVTKNVVFTYQSEMFTKKDKTFQLNKYTSSKQNLAEPILPYIQNYLEVKKQRVRLLGVRCTNILQIEDLKKIQLDKYFLKSSSDDQGDKQGQKSQKIKKQSLPIKTLVCPICNQQIDCKGNLAAFNRHIDKCIIGDTQKSQKQKKQQNYNQSKVNINKQEQENPKKCKQLQVQRKNKSEKNFSEKGSLLSFLKKKIN